MDFNDKVIFDTVAEPPCELAIRTAVTVDERYVNNYRLQQKLRKVMFSETSVSNSVHRG